MKVLSIGSSDIDLFISPEAPSSYVKNENKISFSLGDKVPIKMSATTLGGNASNVSVGLKRLGLDSSLYTFLGKDVLSSHIIESLSKEHIEILESNMKLNTTPLSIIFNFNSDRIIFSHHDVTSHEIDSARLQNFQACYVTSIGKDWLLAYKTLVEFFHTHSVVLAFSPGSPQLADLNDTVYEMIACSKILFVNKEEGEKLLEKKGVRAKDIKELLQNLMSLGPQIVSVTDSKNGSYAMTDNMCYMLPSFDPNALSVDKTGAGDAYASAFFTAHLMEKDIKTSMQWGAVNANSVMKEIGAQKGLLPITQIESTLQMRPDFAVEML